MALLTGIVHRFFEVLACFPFSFTPCCATLRMKILPHTRLSIPSRSLGLKDKHPVQRYGYHTDEEEA